MDDGVGAAHGGSGSSAIVVVVDTGDDVFGAAYGGAGNDFLGAYHGGAGACYGSAFGGGAGAGAGPGGPGRH